MFIEDLWWIILLNKSLIIFLLQNFGWTKIGIIVYIDGNFRWLLIFYAAEAIATSAIEFFDV